MELLTERHADEIAGVLSCYDRILIQGTLPGLCYAEGMTAYLKARQIRIFDCVTPCARMPSDWQPRTAWRPCSSAKRISAKKIG